jgi:hypothetical protein
MSTAKQSFLERIDHFKNSIMVDTLNDHISTDVQHNNIAKILRNGLAVVGFVALEDFIKKRTGEVLKEIGTSTVSFNELPEKLKYSTTVDALPALSRLVKNEPTVNDEISFIQTQTFMLSSTTKTSYELTEYAFGFKSSNLDDGEISRILNAFNINNGWTNMSKLSARIGLTSFPLNNSFKNAATRRNQAAHVAQSNIPINDLEQYTREALGITIGFDSLLTKALYYIKKHSIPYLNGRINIDNTSINLSFIKLEKGLWKYKRENAIRSISQNIDKGVLISNIISIAQIRNETLVIFDENNVINDWFCF